MKKSMVSLVLAAIATQAGAAQPTSIDKLVDCATVSSSQERLACFDREVAPFARARPPAPAATSPRVVAVAPPPAAATASSFGEEQLAPKSRKDTAQEPEALHARIDRVRAAGTGVFLVSLDNGQTWRHEDESNGSYLREGDAITITKGTLGSYRLTRDAGSSKSWIRVTRVR